MNQNNFNVQTNKDLPNRKESNGEGSSQVTDHIVKEIESYVALNPNNTDFRCSLSLSLSLHGRSLIFSLLFFLGLFDSFRTL